MNEDTMLNRCIDEVLQIKNHYALTPQQNRYVDKQVREKGKFQVPKRPRSLPRFLNPAEMSFLIQKAREHRNIVASVACNTLLATGMRIGSLQKLLIEDIDFQNHQILLRGAKGNKDIQVPLSASLASQFRIYLDKRNRGYVFIRSNNKPYSKRQLQNIITQVIRACGFVDKKITTHSLRHTFACLMYSNGMPLESVQLILGHDHKTTTEIYAKMQLSPEIKEKYQQITGGM